MAYLEAAIVGGGEILLDIITVDNTSQLDTYCEYINQTLVEAHSAAPIEVWTLTHAHDEDGRVCECEQHGENVRRYKAWNMPDVGEVRVMMLEGVKAEEVIKFITDLLLGDGDKDEKGGE